MFILIGITFLLLYGLLVFYIGWSGWSWMKPMITIRFKLAYILILVILSTSFILGQLFGNNVFFNVIGAYWLAIFSLLILLLPIVQIMIWLFKLSPVPHRHIQRWAGFITLFTLIGLIGYGSFNAYNPIVRSYDFHIAKEVQWREPSKSISESDARSVESSEVVEDANVRSLNIVMASDMHFGVLSGKAHAERMVNMINELEPDLVLFPGDIIDDHLTPYLEQGIDRILTGIQSKYGVFASLGNHDKHKGTIDELIHALEKSNITVLYDEAITINDQLILIGRKDHSDPARVELSSLTDGLDDSKPLIMMDHQPKDLDIAAQHGIDLIVSGHTHRGQIAPAHLITQRLFENDWGYLQKGQLHSIVSSGYGFWGPPIRIGSRSEIVQMNVTFGE